MENAGTLRTVYVLLGPTASGKSAVGLFVAERMGGEIVSADSMQVYRGMDIGTAKATGEERGRVRHHLIDVREVWESFSTAEYVAMADAAVAEIEGRGKKAIFVGGTALYVKSLLVGIFAGPSADWGFRRKLRAEAEEVGVEALHERLGEVDAAAAERIHPNDMRRIERALEIYEKTGRAASELRREWEGGRWRYDARIAGLAVPREALYARINARVEEMMEAGWLEEVRRLVMRGEGRGTGGGRDESRPYRGIRTGGQATSGTFDGRGEGLGREASQALGYAELAAVVRGEAEVGEAVERIKTRTRQFAKRQMTWFRGFGEAIGWVEVGAGDEAGDLADKVMGVFGLSR